MNIICINESHKKALVRSRRILGKYFNQIGSRTWIGRISKEGLEDIHVELKSSASRHTAVACHQIVTRKRFELQWIVGTRQFFDQHGNFAFRTATSNQIEYKKMAPIIKLFRYIARFAALIHDIGKMTMLFQSKIIEGRPGAEPIRHDLLSCLMLEKIIRTASNKSLKDIKSDKKGWLEPLMQSLEDNDDNLFAHLFDKDGNILLDPKCVGNIKKKLEGSTSFVETQLTNYLNSRNARNQTPILFSIVWLILNHHKLVTGKASNNKIKFKLDNCLNPNHKEKLNKNLQIDLSSQIFQKNGQWVSALKACMNNFKKFLDLQETIVSDMYGDGGKEWIATLVHQVRPLFIYADYQASMDKEFKAKRIIKGKLFANSTGKNKCPADLLEEHLFRVYKQVDHFFRTWHIAESSSSGLNFLHQDDIQPDSLWFDRPSPSSNFAWQLEAEQILLKHKDIQSDTPFLGVVLAGTGTGKTVGGPRILKAISDDMRFTLALGLRTLTLQSGDVYLNDLGLSKEMVTVKIGSQIAKDLYKKSLDNKDDEIEIDLTLSKNKMFDNTFLLFKEKPIMVTTIDQIIRCAEMSRGSECKMLMRVATSDLILDEIDNYSAADIVSIGKLIFLHGLFGKKVILMSATLSPIVFQALSKAYQEGVHVYSWKEGLKAEYKIGLFSNVVPPKIFKGNEKNLTKFDKYALIVAEKLLMQPVKQRLKIVKITENHQEELLRSCFDFHKDNCEIDNKTGKRISMGFVRFNTIKAARKFAQLLYNQGQPNDFEYKIVCYHSNYLLVERAYIEDRLNKILNRKNESEFFEQPEIRTMLDKTKKQDVVIIVSTTSIQETGRDHDYSWCILEPQSTRSGVQAPGRVLRHRNIILGKGQYNVGIFDRPLRSFDGEQEYVWCFPGIETSKLYKVLGNPSSKAIKNSLKNCGITTNKGIGSDEHIIITEEAFNLTEWQTNITAKLCLLKPEKYEDQPLTALEYIEFYDTLFHNDKKYVLVDYIEYPTYKLVDEHVKKTYFRKSNGQQYVDIFIDNPEDKEEDQIFKRKSYETVPTKNLLINNLERSQVLNVDYAFLRSLSKLELLKRYKVSEENYSKYLSGSLSGYSNGLLANDITDGNKKFHYHPLLGFEI